MEGLLVIRRTWDVTPITCKYGVGVLCRSRVSGDAFVMLDNGNHLYKSDEFEGVDAWIEELGAYLYRGSCDAP